jgi:putative NIF3 family GTP cyclohydrolase 1 type 2
MDAILEKDLPEAMKELVRQEREVLLPMKTKALVRKLATRFPKRIAEPGDRVGLMTGKFKEKTKRIVVCLDFDEEVMRHIEALDGGPVDLILTHHPFLYRSRYQVFKKDEIKRRLTEKVDALGIPVYSMHTNFDSGKDGMNDALASALNLCDIRRLESMPMARGGRLAQKMPIKQFAEVAARLLNVPYGLLINAARRWSRRWPSSAAGAVHFIKMPE